MPGTRSDPDRQMSHASVQTEYAFSPEELDEEIFYGKGGLGSGSSRQDSVSVVQPRGEHFSPLHPQHQSGSVQSFQSSPSHEAMRDLQFPSSSAKKAPMMSTANTPMKADTANNHNHNYDISMTPDQSAGRSRQDKYGARNGNSNASPSGGPGPLYVDGGVHASDGGRCHPSIRGDI